MSEPSSKVKLPSLDEMCSSLKTEDRPIRILLLGLFGNGKTSFFNIINRMYASPEWVHYKPVGAPLKEGAADRPPETRDFARLRLKKYPKIELIDSRGFSFHAKEGSDLTAELKALRDARNEIEHKLNVTVDQILIVVAPFKRPDGIWEISARSQTTINVLITAADTIFKVPFRLAITHADEMEALEDARRYLGKNHGVKLGYDFDLISTKSTEKSELKEEQTKPIQELLEKCVKSAMDHRLSLPPIHFGRNCKQCKVFAAGLVGCAGDCLFEYVHPKPECSVTGTKNPDQGKVFCHDCWKKKNPRANPYVWWGVGIGSVLGVGALGAGYWYSSKEKAK